MEQGQARTAGRYRLNEEDKAKQVPLKLNQEYLMKLEFLPGKNTAEKIRNLIDNSCQFQERERRQLREVERLIPSIHSLAMSLVDPELKEDKAKFLKEKERFLKSLSGLEALIDVLHFEIKSLKKGLSAERFKQLEIIFFVKASLAN